MTDLAAQRRCPHPEAAWSTDEGVRTCERCGVRRFVDYRAVGLAVDLPEALTRHGVTVVGAGIGAFCVNGASMGQGSGPRSEAADPASQGGA
ncbi:DUF6255 family natural product biosynthesis protein [Streptomyces cinnamoneus]|uniref:DUF6255 family natural product biosynthesis protein n=1 Tax=Streptomyces cinnamoneus TaxID=53446 RepID=UPI0037BD4CE9